MANLGDTIINGVLRVNGKIYTSSISGNASTATKLATARKINGVSFDGSADITLPTATTTANGLMTFEDKSKLNSIGDIITKTVKK